MAEKVVLGLSGGVDSAVAAARSISRTGAKRSSSRSVDILRIPSAMRARPTRA